jgi:hypothetical protein
LKDATPGEMIESTYTLNLSGKFPVLTTKLKQKVGGKEIIVDYIYERDGDMLKICSNLLPGKVLPMEFSAPEGSKRMYAVFKRGKPESEITAEMRAALERINKIKKGSEQKEIDEAVEALNKEIARLNPKVFVPLAVPHLLRLAPKDTRTRALLRQALEKGWIEEQLARAFLVQAGDPPEPHIKQLVKELDGADSKIRTRAINALSACGAAAEPALPKLREIVKNAKADPNDYSRAFTSRDEAPEHVRAHWAIRIIEAALSPTPSW